MYKEILYPEQLKILELLEVFSDDFYLAGGTAIALQIWHRKSIDFDLFSSKPLKNQAIINTLKKNGFEPSQILIDTKWEELTMIIDGVKVTFLYYPFDIPLDENISFEWIQLPNLQTLWAMKLYTLGRRWKYKDYVDIYFLLQQLSIWELSALTDEIFDWGYNEKLMREQLCYFEDIDFSEEVEFLGEPISQEKIQKQLEKYALNS